MGKVIRDEDLRLNVIVNGDSGRKKILDLEKAVDASTASIRQMRKEQEMLAKQGQTDTARYKELSAAIKAETATVKQNKAEIEALRRQMSVNSMTIAELTNRAKQLRAQLANMAPGTAEWERVNKQLQETNSRLAELRGQSGRAGTSMGALTGGIAKFAAGVGAALIVLRRAWSVIREGAQTIGDFEQANVDLAAILGKNVEDISLLTDEALRLGAATKYTATQATGLQIELAKLGFTEREIIAMGEPVLNFATAIGADLSEAAALSGAALRMFGLQAEDTEDVLATLTLSTNKSALSFNYYQTALATVGPVAKTFGLGVKDTAALLGTLANAGFEASSAATATRNIILNLANANGKLAKALGEPVRTFPELMDGLKRLNAQGIDLATTLELTDKRSVAAFNTFLAGADSAISLRSELENTSGVLEDIAEKKMNTAEGAMTSLKSAWERFTLSQRCRPGAARLHPVHHPERESRHRRRGGQPHRRLRPRSLGPVRRGARGRRGGAQGSARQDQPGHYRGPGEDRAAAGVRRSEARIDVRIPEPEALEGRGRPPARRRVCHARRQSGIPGSPDVVPGRAGFVL